MLIDAAQHLAFAAVPQQPVLAVAWVSVAFDQARRSLKGQ
jgi:hypothetical protein